MPKGQEAHRFFERLIILEQVVKNLVGWQKWQMGLLAAILLLALKNWVR